MSMNRGLADFVGTYVVSRRIEDRRTGVESLFDGTAKVVLSDAGATYTETGHLVMGAQRFAAERTYLWCAVGGRIEVLFEDGRAFHDFDPDAGGAATEHLCGQDTYRGGYDLSRWPVWSLTWDVTGPRKDYRSVTTYTGA